MQRVSDLEQALAARDEFIATLGHELRNPLTPLFLQIRYFIDVAARAGEQPLSRDWLVPRLEAFERRLHGLLATLNRILDVPRITAGKLELELSEVDLAEVTREVVASLEREFAVAQCEVTQHADKPVVGHWDRLRLEQICWNLLTNAVRYGAGHPITVTVDGDATQAWLVIADGGIGISAEDQQRIFERFERAAVRPSGGGGGVGLGLWLVKNITSALGGSVQVDSVVGQGSTFAVTLPRRRLK